ncbi:MAG: TonB-dependent receptor [Chitinophagales bacterium]|nr:TonB-dependent receptor [Bacteroidota bacterium]MCB9044018.1 TonB-dependent receptor [Chitinophagales bacterium]
MKKYFFFVLTLLLQQNVFSQCDIHLQGQVLDEHDGSPLSFSNIQIVGSQQGIATDSLGFFSLQNLCKGKISLRISHIGCETVEKSFVLKNDSTIVFFLEHHTEHLETIQIHANKPNELHGEHRAELSSNAIEQMLGKSLSDVLEQFEGISSLQTGANIAKPMIDGLHSTRIVIVNSGLKQEGQDWGAEHAPEIDAQAAGKIEVIRGAETVKYGFGVLGGVIIISPPSKPESNELKGSVGANFQSNGKGFSTRLNIGQKWKHLSNFAWRLQSSFDKSGDLHAPNYNLTNTGHQSISNQVLLYFTPKNQHFLLRLSNVTQQIGILEAAHIGNLTDFYNALASDRPLIVKPFSYAINNPKQISSHYITSLQYKYLFPKGNILQLQYAWQYNHRQEFDVRRGNFNTIPALNMQLFTHSFEAHYSHSLSKNWSGSVGAETIYQQNRNDSDTGIRPLIPWYNQLQIGVYAWEKYEKNRFLAEMAVRFQTQQLQVKKYNLQNELLDTLRHFEGIIYSFGAAYKLSEHLQCNLNLNTALRPPHVSELYSEGLHHALASYEQGNDALRLEKGLKILQTWEWHSDIFFADIQFHWQNIRDFIYLLPQDEPVLSIRGAFPVFNYVQTNAQLWGSDFNAQLLLGKHWKIKSAFTFLRAKDTSNDSWLWGFPPNSGNIDLTYSWQNNGNVKDWEISFATSHTASQKQFPANIDYLPPPPAYTLYNLAANAHIALGKNILGIVLEINNLFNTSYRSYTDRLRYYADSMGRNISFTLNYNF